jgi:hypothetical protein
MLKKLGPYSMAPDNQKVHFPQSVVKDLITFTSARNNDLIVLTSLCPGSKRCAGCYYYCRQL